MARKQFDPLTFIPTASVIREKLVETETLAKRLRILLDVAVRVEASEGTHHTPHTDHKRPCEGCDGCGHVPSPRRCA